MRKSWFVLFLIAFAFFLFAAVEAMRADDLSALLRSCGKGATIVTNAPLAYDAAESSDYNDGLWHRTVEYRTDGMFVDFTAKSKNGPWVYKNSLLKQLPCLASSSIVPAQTSQSGASITPAASGARSNNGGGYGMALILVLIFLYFIPTIVAMARNCKARNGIEVVNLFLGWTFIGWVVALAWAASGEPKPKPLPAAPRATD
jgi:hypothetical protein